MFLSSKRFRYTMLGGCLLFLSGLSPLHAQIYVGQTAGFTGAVAARIKENLEGINLYLDAVNARGGVNGHRIELLSLDDKFDPKNSAENAKVLITEKNVIAMFMNSGTPHNEAILPLLAQHKVPLVAPSTGAMVFHNPVNPYVFNVRASYQREAERVIRHLKQVNVTRIALLSVDDSFGADSVKGAETGFAAVGLSPVLRGKFDRKKPDFVPLALDVSKSGAQAVLLIGASQSVADGARAIRAAGSRAQIITLSNNAAQGFITQMGEYARGTIITQVFPNERSVSFLLVKETLDLAKAKGLKNVSPAILEGVAASKVLVEGLRRAGNIPTRASLLAALNGMRKFDIGGMEVSFSPDDHTGLDFVDLSIVNEAGRLLR